jgi:hypothetical protein
MSQTLLAIDDELVETAITDLSAKIADLSQGSQTATRHFEKFIGSDGHPDLSLEDRITRLLGILGELKLIKKALNDESGDVDVPPLSDHTEQILSDYIDERGPLRLEGPHVLIGPGIPSAKLYQAAAIARGHMTKLLRAFCDERMPEPAVTFLPFFEAYEEVLDAEGLEAEDDTNTCDAAISYLTSIVDNLDTAWATGIEVPECLHTHVLKPFLDGITVRLH